MIITGILPSESVTHHVDGRRLLSIMLSRFVGIDKAEITIEKNGKPRIDGTVFSISHSAGLVMCSIFVSSKSSSLPFLSEGEEVVIDGEMFFVSEVEECYDIGIDLEMISDVRDEKRLRALVERYFSASEREFVLSGGGIGEKFYQIWTEKESYLKLTGEGLSGLRHADTSELGEGIKSLSFRVFHSGVKYSASICYRGR